jgi:hypothetical protein
MGNPFGEIPEASRRLGIESYRYLFLFLSFLSINFAFRLAAADALPALAALFWLSVISCQFFRLVFLICFTSYFIEQAGYKPISFSFSRD